MKKTLCLTIIFLLIGAGSVLARNDIIAIIGDPGYYGVWGPWQYCPPGSYAAGYGMKVEPDQGSSDRSIDIILHEQANDDTAVNGIKLICVDQKTRAIVAGITSNIGAYGSWREDIYCLNTFLQSVRFKNEPPQGKGDDTGTNSVKFVCSNGQTVQANGTMPWGSWGPYYQCPGTSVICGIQTRVEGPQGSKDDTSLNGANFACCPLSP